MAGADNGSVADHVTPSRAADLLRRHDLRAGRRYGQHFLVDPNTVRRIVRLAALDETDTVLEIGPGVGSLTVELARACRRVVALEIDAAVLPALREVAGGLDGVEIVAGDALVADIGALLPEPAVLVSNLPYNVATPILLRVLDEVPVIGRGLVMVQREVGERWTSPPGSRAYGSVGVHIGYHARARIVGDVPATVFMPPPDVASVLVSFERRTQPPVEVDDPAVFFAFVRTAFAHRRKTLRNALVAGGLDRGEVESAIRDCDLEPGVRPEALDIAAFAALHRRLSSWAAA